MFVSGSRRNEQSLWSPFQRYCLPSCASFGQAVPEEKIFQKSTNQKQELTVAAMFIHGSGQNEQPLYRGPFIDASYQVSVHLAKRFQRRRLKCEKLTDDRRRMPSDGKCSLCFWQGELKRLSPQTVLFCHQKWLHPRGFSFSFLRVSYMYILKNCCLKPNQQFCQLFRPLH